MAGNNVGQPFLAVSETGRNACLTLEALPSTKGARIEDRRKIEPFDGKKTVREAGEHK
jgi:hypothetical protein